MKDQSTNKLISLIFSTGQMLRERARSGGRFGACSFLHIQTLRYIKKERGAAMKALARQLHITPPSATALSDLLVKNGLIKKTLAASDRRVTRLTITDKGNKFLDNHFKKIVSVMKKNLRVLDRKEKINFINILNKLSKEN